MKNLSYFWNQLFKYISFMRLSCLLYLACHCIGSCKNNGLKALKFILTNLFLYQTFVTYDDVFKYLWIFWLIDGLNFFFLQILQRKKSTDDELCGIEIYYTFLSIAKKETVRPRCLISANDFFRIMRVSPHQVSNSRSINDYRCKSSRFKANTAIIMPIQIVCLIWIHTYIWFYCNWYESTVNLRCG